MKFNRSEIMKAAWKKYSRFDITFAQALRLAWVDAKMAVARFNVWGENFNEEPVLLGSNLTYDQAGELKWRKETSYDFVEIKAA